jgi:hypothetical protein
MRLVISQPMFFPWVGHLEQIKLCQTYIHYVDVQYSKGSFTNRVQVKSASGAKWMTVPLEGLKLGQTIDVVKINNSRDWRSEHYALLDYCYRPAPYFSEMMDLVQSVYSERFQYIHDLSRKSIETLCDYFGLNDTLFRDIRELKIDGHGSDRVLETALRVGAKTYVTGHGARNYLEHEKFEKYGLEVEYMDYRVTQYPQLHGAFNGYVSALDLVANIGRDGAEIIQSGTVNWRDFVDE